MAQSDLIIRIGADVNRLTQGLDNATKRLKRFSFRAESVGRDLTTRLTLPLAAIGTAAIKTFADFDRLEKGLSAVTGSAAEGAKQFKEYVDLVKDTQTTLSLRGTVSAALRFQSVGLSAENANRTIRQLGIAATVTGSSMDDVNGVARQFTQILAKGKIEQEDFNSILERLPALAEIIKQEFGASTAEQVRDTGVSMEEFVLRTVAAAEQSSVFQNVQGGLAKSFEAFSIELQIAGNELGKAISKSINLEKILKDLSAFVSRVVDGFTSLSPAMQNFIIVSAGVAAAAGPVIFSMGAIAKTIPILRSGFSILTGPISKITSLLFGLGKGFTSSIGLFVRSGAVQKAIILSDALVAPFKLLRVAFVALTGPIGLIVGGIALLTAAFIRAYNRSETFRKTVAPIIDLFKNIGSAIGNVAKSVLPEFSGVLDGLGVVLDVVLASVAAFGAGLINFVQEPFKFINKQVQAFALLINGQFQESLSTFISSFTDFGKESANTFVDVFSETLNKELPKKVKVIDPSGLFLKNTDPVDLPVGVISPNLITSTGVEPEEVVDTGSQQLNFLQELERQLSAVSNKAIVLGGSYDETAEKIALLNNALNTSIEEGFKPTSARVTGLVDRLQELRGAKDLVSTTFISSDNSDILALAETETKALSTAAAMESLNQKVGQLKVNAPKKNVFAELEQAFFDIEERAIAFGSSFDVTNAKIDATREALQLAFEQYGSGSAQVEALRNQLQGLISTQEEIEESTQRTATILGSALGRLSSIFDDLATASISFAQAATRAIRQVIGALIRQGVAAAISKTLQGPAGLAGPLAIPIAAAAGSLANAAFQTILSGIGVPALAEGGITTGPTLALIGEAGTEVVMPLDKLNRFVKDREGGGQVTGTIRASGQELLVLIENAQRAQNRAF